MEIKKVTKTTFKTFIKKNKGKLFIKVKTKFDGMTDGCESVKNAAFAPVVETAEYPEHKYGMQGAWLVGGGGDRFRPYAAGGFNGLEVYNCCGHFVVAVRND